MIDKNRIKDNLEQFSVPRLSGSKSEEEVFKFLKEKINKLNITFNSQKFSFSSFYSRVYPKISLILLFSILFILVLHIFEAFVVIYILIVIIFFIFLLIITRNPDRIKLGKKFNSQNVFVQLNSKKSKDNNENVPLFDDKSSNIFLFSHIDSKGQRFTIQVRVISVWFWIISIIVGFILNLIDIIFILNANKILQILELFILSFNFIFTLIIIVNTTNNKSKGAIDNASGVSCVLELLNYYLLPDNRLKNYNLWFVFTGAEECGTMGIRKFYQFLLKSLDRAKNYTINFDSICNKIFLYNHNLITELNPRTLKLVSEKKEIIELKKSKIVYPGIRSDGLYLMQKNFTGLGIGDESVYQYIHSVEDTVDKVNIAVLADLCNLITVLLNEIDNI